MGALHPQTPGGIVAELYDIAGSRNGAEHPASRARDDHPAALHGVAFYRRGGTPRAAVYGHDRGIMGGVERRLSPLGDGVMRAEHESRVHRPAAFFERADDELRLPADGAEDQQRSEDQRVRDHGAGP